MLIFFVIHCHEKEKIYITNKYNDNESINDEPTNDDS